MDLIQIVFLKDKICATIIFLIRKALIAKANVDIIEGRSVSRSIILLYAYQRFQRKCVVF